MRTAGFDALDLIGGLLIAAGGVVFMIAAGAYPMGTLQRMGPGYLPLVTGAVLAAIGLGLIVASRASANEFPNVSLRPVFAIFAGLVWFALTIERFGLAPSIIGMVALTALAQDRPNWKMMALTIGCLLALSVGIFIYALKMPVAPIRI